MASEQEFRSAVLELIRTIEDTLRSARTHLEKGRKQLVISGEAANHLLEVTTVVAGLLILRAALAAVAQAEEPGDDQKNL